MNTPGNTTARVTPARILSSLALLALAGVFLHAGISKIGDPAGFARDIELYRVVPRVFAVVTALYLPWLEIGCALAVFVRALRGGALALLALCNVVFTIMLASALARGLDISCGCFGAGGATGPTALLASLARAVLLAIACAWLLHRHTTQTQATGKSL